MSSFSQESSVGNEVLVEKGKDSSVEIEEAVKNHVTDGAADTKQHHNVYHLMFTSDHNLDHIQGNYYYQSVSCTCIHCSCTGVCLEKIVSSKEGG